MEPSRGDHPKILSEHDELAMSEVDGPDGTINKDKSKADKGVDTSHGYAAQHFLNHRSFLIAGRAQSGR